jgi:hypothetical protein
MCLQPDLTAFTQLFAICWALLSHYAMLTMDITNPCLACHGYPILHVTTAIVSRGTFALLLLPPLPHPYPPKLHLERGRSIDTHSAKSFGASDIFAKTHAS